MSEKEKGQVMFLVADCEGGIPLGASVQATRNNPMNQPNIVVVQPVVPPPTRPSGSSTPLAPPATGTPKGK